jgi:hypothetical protein
MLRAYDFRCPKGHTTEHFLSSFAETVVCGESGCAEQSEYSPSFWYSSALQAERRIQNAQGFSPVVIHKDAQGNIRFPAHASAPVPEGFQKVELTTIQQVRSLEREVNLKDREIAGKFRQTKRDFTDAQLKENRRIMEGLISKFTPRGRRFYAAMRKQSELRQQQGSRHINPEFVVDAFSYDQSNRDPYYNEHGGSHRR